MTALWALALSPADARAGSLRPSDPEQTWLEAEGLARDARELERDDPQGAVERYLGAARLFEALADEREQPASACWRGARAFWAAGDTLALEEKQRRV